jgi:hypothetical protein
MKRVAKRFPAKQQYWISLGDDLARCGDKLAAKEAYSHASRAGESLTLRAVATQRMKDIQ